MKRCSAAETHRPTIISRRREKACLFGLFTDANKCHILILTAFSVKLKIAMLKKLTPSNDTKSQNRSQQIDKSPSTFTPRQSRGSPTGLKLKRRGRSLPLGRQVLGWRSSSKKACAQASSGDSRVTGVYSSRREHSEMASGGVRGLNTCRGRRMDNNVRTAGGQENCSIRVHVTRHTAQYRRVNTFQV